MKRLSQIIVIIFSLFILCGCASHNDPDTPSLDHFKAPPTYGNDAMTRVHMMK
jgi:PBP1b-binding outer membrane lipoprotein LpoB